MAAQVAIAVLCALAGLGVVAWFPGRLQRRERERLSESIRRLEVATGIGTDDKIKPLLLDFLTSDWRERQSRRWRYGD